MVKGTKLDVAFLNMSINTWFNYYLAFDIIFSSLNKFAKHRSKFIEIFML